MKLICVNDKNIDIKNGIANNVRDSNGKLTSSSVIEGQEYETNGEPYISSSGNLCYYIVGKGQRLACRFTKALNQSKKEEISIEKQIEKAISEENYELAEVLKGKMK